MPFKLICKACGITMYSSKEIATVPDVIYERLHGKCPKCNRKITTEDLDNFTLKITGQKGDRAFFSKPASRIGKEVLGFTVVRTSKKKHKITGNYLVVGHDEPEEF